MSTPSRDDAKGKDWMTDGVFVADQYSPSFHVMCKREKFLEIRNLILAALPPEAFVADFDRENIEEIAISDLSHSQIIRPSHSTFLYFLLAVFSAIAITMTIIGLSN